MRSLHTCFVGSVFLNMMLAISSARSAGVLYDEDFTGLPTTVLHGTTPDVDNNGGFATWAAHTGFKDSGAIVPANGGRGAWLPFAPTIGDTYTLSASLRGVTGNTNWFAIGFAQSLPPDPQGVDARFITGPTAGRAWMLYRGTTNATTPNQYFAGSATAGNPAAGTFAWSGGPTGGGDVDLRIILNTSAGAGNFTATYFAKLATDVSYTQVSTGAIDLDAENIGAVGLAFSAATGIAGSVDRFTLETSGNLVVPGDVDGDQVADADDFFIIRDNLFDTVASRSLGDLNNDAFVDFTDFRLWKNAAPPAVSAGLVIPEPAALGLLAVGMASVLMQRRRRSVIVRQQAS